MLLRTQALCYATPSRGTTRVGESGKYAGKRLAQIIHASYVKRPGKP